MENVGFAEEVHRLISLKKSFVTATVVKTDGSSLAKPGFKVVVVDGSITYGTLGGACPESVIIDAANTVMKTGIPRTIRVHLEESGKGLNAMISRQTPDDIYVETFCGGTMEVFLEPFKPLERLIIFGQGGKDDIENSLVDFGKKCDFEVTVVDHAPALSCSPDHLVSEIDFDVSELNISERDYVVLLTKGDMDISILRGLSNFKPAYIGLLASRKRSAHDFEELRKSGVSDEFLKRVRTPIGLDIGAVTPQEIALSIMAEIIRARRQETADRPSTSEKKLKQSA